MLAMEVIGVVEALDLVLLSIEVVMVVDLELDGVIIVKKKEVMDH